MPPLDEYADLSSRIRQDRITPEPRREKSLASDPVRVPKTAEIVADRIRRRIIQGDLREGDFLPPEGQLLASLGISRPTLREAFRILEAENLISVLRGSRSGARVHLPRVETVSRFAGFVLQAQGTTVADIYEARLAIEPYVARRLAERRPPGATQRLRAQIDLLRIMVDEQRYIDFMIALAEFHTVLVEVSGIQTLLFVTRQLQGVLERHQVRFFEVNRLPQDEQRKRSLWGIRSFEKLVELIESGQGERAESHWRLHIINANAAWVPDGQGTAVIDVFD
jgi:DNA-binding FadR family transcriptional regulator